MCAPAAPPSSSGEIPDALIEASAVLRAIANTRDGYVDKDYLSGNWRITRYEDASM
jgi:hypothetical protein